MKNSCPTCESEQVYYERPWSWPDDDTCILREAFCNECQTEWTEQFEMVNQTDIKTIDEIMEEVHG